MSTFWDLGAIVGPIIAVLLIVGLALLGRYARRRQIAETNGNVIYNDGGEWRFLKWACLVVAIVVVGITVISSWPLEARFHQWRSVEGTVQSVDVRRLDGIYLVVIEDQPYKVSDTRAAALRAGDHVALVCIDRWQYAGVSGTECNWNAQ